MNFLPALLAVNPSFISVGSVLLAITVLTGTLGTLAYKATQSPKSE